MGYKQTLGNTGRRSPYFVGRVKGLGASTYQIKEYPPITGPGYYLSVITFKPGSGVLLSELPGLSDKIKESMEEKYGDDAEVGRLIKTDTNEYLTPDQGRAGNYKEDSLDFQSDGTVLMAFPGDDTGGKLSRLFFAIWMKRWVNVDDKMKSFKTATVDVGANGEITNRSFGETSSWENLYGNGAENLRRIGLTPESLGSAKIHFGGQTFSGGETYWKDDQGNYFFITDSSGSIVKEFSPYARYIESVDPQTGEKLRSMVPQQLGFPWLLLFLVVAFLTVYLVDIETLQNIPISYRKKDGTKAKTNLQDYFRMQVDNFLENLFSATKKGAIAFSRTVLVPILGEAGKKAGKILGTVFAYTIAAGVLGGAGYATYKGVPALSRYIKKKRKEKALKASQTQIKFPF